MTDEIETIKATLNEMLVQIEAEAHDRIDAFWAEHFRMNSERKPSEKGRLQCWVRRKKTTIEIWWTTFQFQKTNSGPTITLKRYVPKGRQLNYSPAVLARHAKCDREAENARSCEAQFSELRKRAAEINKMYRSLHRLEKQAHQASGETA